METVGERLTYFIQSNKLSKLNFCLVYGLNYNSLLPITSDKKEMGMTILKQLISKFPLLSCDWLLFGKGEMLLKQELTKDNSKELILRFDLGTGNSELVERLEQIIKSDNGSHKLPNGN
jgi:hypothetical protein